MSDRSVSDTPPPEADTRVADQTYLLIDALRDYAIFMLDKEGHVTSWNRGAARLIGYEPAEIVGQHISIFYTPEDRHACHADAQLKKAQDEGRCEEQGWRLRKNGEPFWAHVGVTAIYDEAEQLQGFAKVTRDLTEQRQAHEETRAAEERATQEKERAMEAALALKVRDEFISMAAHDLRTPLTALRLRVQGIEQLLRKTAKDAAIEFPAKLWDRVSSVKQQVERFAHLIDRLLDFSRIAGGRLEILPEKADIAHLVRQTVDEFREPAAEEGVQIELNVPPTAEGVWDATRVQQVVANLLSNALKYGAGKPVSVTLEQTDDEVSIAVRDHGIGIKASDFDIIFARFERTAAAQNYAGLGLGLYITKHILSAHGGRVEVASAIDCGSTFTVRLPRHGVAIRNV